MESRNTGTSTSVLEPVELQPVRTKQDVPSLSSRKPSSATEGRILGIDTPKAQKTDEDSDRNETLPSPTTAAADQIQSWNRPRINIYRVCATFWSFIVMGLNDATYGAIIPYLEDYYNLTYTVVALVFLSPFLGYNIAALLNNWIHLKFGQRGVAFMGPICHLVSYIITSLHPPYPVLVISFMIAGLGHGIEDSAWNAWIGAMANANEMLGFLHGFYGVGGTIAPLIATTLITKAGVPWYYWYYIMVRLSLTFVKIPMLNLDLDRLRNNRSSNLHPQLLGFHRSRISRSPCTNNGCKRLALERGDSEETCSESHMASCTLSSRLRRSRSRSRRLGRSLHD